MTEAASSPAVTFSPAILMSCGLVLFLLAVAFFVLPMIDDYSPPEDVLSTASPAATPSPMLSPDAQERGPAHNRPTSSLVDKDVPDGLRYGQVDGDADATLSREEFVAACNFACSLVDCGAVSCNVSMHDDNTFPIWIHATRHRCSGSSPTNRV